MALAQQKAMHRKPILMPSNMINKINKIAHARKVSFAEVVREAVDAFDENVPAKDAEFLEAMADTLIQSTRDAIRKIEEVEKRLDETHTMLEGHHGDQ
jgi:hypothetical protein